MTYDTKTVLSRYQQLQDLPDGESEAGPCPALREAGQAEDASCMLGDCRNCCLGVVEVVRRVHAHQVDLEPKELTLSDTLTQAHELEHGKR